MRRGTRVGQAYVAVTADGDGINEEIVNSVDEAGPGVEKAGDRHGERYGDHFSEGFLSRIRGKLTKRLNEHLTPDMDKTGTEAGDRLGASLGNALVERLRERLTEADDVVVRMSERLDKAMQGRTSVSKLDIMAHSLRTAENAAARVERQLRATMKAEGLLGEVVSRNDRQRRTGLTGIDDWLRGTSSRNNFIHFFTQALGGMIHGLEKMVLLGGDFAKNFRNAGEGATLLQRTMAGFTGGAGGAGGIAKAFSGIASSGPAAAAAIIIVVAASSAMVSVVGSLLAIVTALTSAIVSGLVGALAVLGGAILAVVAAGGLLTAAFMSMTDAQQKMLKSAFMPIRAEMVGIGQIMLRDMVPAFGTWSKNIQSALMLVVPVAERMGKAFAQAGNILTASFSGPGFRAFSTALATYLPSIVTRLSTALGGFLNGTLGLFAVLMPYVNQFAGWLARIATEFSNWATSAKGKNAIADFVTRAMTSLQSLWDFVSAFGGFLSKILFSPEAQNAGSTMFTGIANAFRDMTNNIARAQADGSLKRWFDDAIKFGSQLWSVISALGGTFMSLYNSGVITGIGNALGTMASIISAVNSVLGPLVGGFGMQLPLAMMAVLTPLQAVASAVIAIGQAIKWALGLVGIGSGGFDTGAIMAPFGGGGGGVAPQNVVPGTVLTPKVSLPSMPSIQSSGFNALANTSIGSGGFKKPKKWKNPWKKWAQSLIKEGPSVSAQIKNAMLSVNRQAAAGILAASRATDSGDMQASMQSLVESIQTTGAQAVNTARSALNNAATSLANATSKGAAKKALTQVRKSQRDLRAALTNQTRINRAAAILNAQKIVSEPRVRALLSGMAVNNATLADYAEARSRVATMLDDANQKLADAISLRDDYKNQVADSIKSFGSLLTAQAQTIGGVEQALTANDITGNLQSRLDKIKTFQSNLRILLAQGLSNDAYEQIVDAGVDQGSTFANALISGGTGSIQQVNSLVSQINGIADSLGTETSSRLYQAGVDAAQGLVDGLTSLSAQLDAAALRLGNSIALAVKRALGIASPSRVLRAMMDDVGDGAVLGLDDQHVKVGSAAARMAAQIGVSPASTYAASPASAVSGNGSDQKFRDLIIQTPTKDPKAVALEAVNEITGRI